LALFPLLSSLFPLPSSLFPLSFPPLTLTLTLTPFLSHHSPFADLKPDNIGIGADGSIKLLDFGLAVCVRQRSSLDEAYDMTGFTGSLRYMSPEVAQRRPYNERVDQYSFALVVWQMATGQTPFKGFTKDQLLQEVVAEGRRPPLDSKQISPDLAKLLARCWHASPSRRPAFSEVVAEMARMLDKECGAESRPLAAQVGSSGASAWF